jgi:hypothetical protein
MNWFLYIVTNNFLDVDGELIKSGNAGVGQCSMSPGIIDAPHGTMYVVSNEAVKGYFNERGIRSVKPHHVRQAIEAFYSCREEAALDDEEFVFD